MNEQAQTQDAAFAEPADVQERNLWLGVRVMGGVTILFFLAFLFGYFYLRSLNNAGKWRPDGVDPPQAYGAAIIILFVVSAAALVYADRAARGGRVWLPAAGLSLALGLAGCVVQAFEYAHLGFSPRNGGYASIFMGWTLMFAVFVLLAMYWAEITFATGIRQRRTAGYVPHGLDAAAFYWTLLAVIGVIAWGILYLV